MSDDTEVGDLAHQGETLTDSLSGASDMAAQFSEELKRMRESFAATGHDAKVLERGLSRGLRRAFDGVIFGGQSLSDALESMARSMIQTTYSAAIKPVTDHFGGLLAQGVTGLVQDILPFADGAAFSQGRVRPFANGGVVSGPVHFPMRGGMGLMGEAGPEAIVPLARGPDGKLGVRSAGGGAVNVVMNITTPDAESFRRSQGQIAARMGRVLQQGRRNS
jgi:phage-related minor tail protein